VLPAVHVCLVVGPMDVATLARMPLFRDEEEARVRRYLATLERPVELFLALGLEETPLAGAREIDFGAEALRLCEELAALADGVTLRTEEQPPGFERFPAISVRPEGREAGVRYEGLPWGYELSSLVGGILEAGRIEPSLSAESIEALSAIPDRRDIQVFVTPT
jgi:alkyl hydroperoxide reductase subunit F